MAESGHRQINKKIYRYISFTGLILTVIVNMSNYEFITKRLLIEIKLASSRYKLNCLNNDIEIVAYPVPVRIKKYLLTCKNGLK